MATNRKPTEKFFQLCAEADLLRDLKMLAARKNSTMNAEIVEALHEHLDLEAATAREQENHGHGSRRHADNHRRQSGSRP